MTILSATKPSTTPARRPAGRPRVGFLGTGWIGRHRLQAVAESGVVEIAAVADASAEARVEALKIAPDAAAVESLDALLAEDLDGLVIATPSALHAWQSIEAFERGLAVFCQKPLARTAAETGQILAAARRQDRLLAVDFSYRYVNGVPRMRELIRSGELGELYAADLTFHNAYGPDKPWFHDPKLSGGGCVIDLGSHLVDLALWMFDFPAASRIESRLYRDGRPVADTEREVEDYAVAQWDFATGATVRLACSWRLSAGCDAVIETVFYGTKGAVALRNVNGSFYDFTAEHDRGTAREIIASPPDAWGGRAAVHWAERLAAGEHFDPQSERLIDVARVLDGIYQR